MRHHIPSRRLLAVLLILPLLALATSPEDEAWLNDDAEFRALAVNEGELVFLESAPQRAVHHHQNHIVLHPSSLDDGWVTLLQCHDNLDAVSKAQVVYHEHRSRSLVITAYSGIDRAWVEGPTVQLENIAPGARLCIRVETRSLEANEDGSYTLRNGPFMRRFLDGYYPMRVSIDVEVPEDYLRFASVQPPRQDGFRVWESADGVHVDALFEGRLRTELRFETNFCDNPGPTTC